MAGRLGKPPVALVLVKLSRRALSKSFGQSVVSGGVIGLGLALLYNIKLSIKVHE